MDRYFRAVAIDYDGTLTESGPPDLHVVDAIAEFRRTHGRALLVTGRILEDLRAAWPAVETAFDAIVAENGAVLWLPGSGARVLAQPVPLELEDALAARGVPLARGKVLLATDGVWDRGALEEITHLGLEVQLVHNRSALILLPSGVSKGTGLLAALEDLGISRHSTVAVGDAENDHTLLETCEIGVAVANAVPSLQAHADVVLRDPDGAGVRSLLRGAILDGRVRIRPKRWQIRIGTAPDGAPVTLPGSQVNLLITGGAASGKSHLAGLVIERLVAMGYLVWVIDPEGDHVGLGALRDVVVKHVPALSGAPPEISSPRPSATTVFDLSAHGSAERAGWCRWLLAEAAQARQAAGVPHWVVLDEAHVVPDAFPILRGTAERPPAGVCLVTYHPGELHGDTLGSIDYVLTLQAPKANIDDGSGPRPFVPDVRRSAHVRHWHKYLTALLPHHQRFFFRSAGGLTGASAANIPEFHHELERCESAVLLHHARARDFSRWTELVLRDAELATTIGSVEARIAGGPEAEVEPARRDLLVGIERRYRDPTA
jgi:hypothetical protein